MEPTSACGLVSSVRSRGDLVSYQRPLPTGGQLATLRGFQLNYDGSRDRICVKDDVDTAHDPLGLTSVASPPSHRRGKV